MKLSFKQSILILFLLPGMLLAKSIPYRSQPEVKKFIDHMVKKHSFNRQDLIKIFNNVKERPVIIKAFKAPAEQKPWYLYQLYFVNEWRVREGLIFWQKYQHALEKAEKIYGVPASIIVATIGVETKYGTNIGKHRVIDALVNLSFNHTTRAAFFRRELEEFLLLTKEHHLNPLTVMGSYAGAIGQPQFMPSSYRQYAINFSKSGKIDLTNNEVDVIGSIANYYQKHGWQTNKPIAMLLTLKNKDNLQHFSQLDLARYGLTAKLKGDKKANFLQLQGRFGSEYWETFPNFNVIKRYNSSNLYAMAVYQLSNDIIKLKKALPKK